MLEFKLGCYRPYPLKGISSPRFSWAGPTKEKKELGRGEKGWARLLGLLSLFYFLSYFILTQTKTI